jgi:hypothetical protein
LPAVDALIGYLGAPDPVVRATAAAALVDHGVTALKQIEEAASSGEGAKAALAGQVRMAIRLALRLTSDLPIKASYWMTVEDIVALDPPALRDAALRKVLGNDNAAADLLAKRAKGRQAAIDFCRGYDDGAGGLPATSNPDVAAANKRYEGSLQAAGGAAAPYLLWLLSRDPTSSFHVTMHGPRSGRDFVIAMHAVGLLRVSGAVPYLIRWVGGPSAWAHGVSLQTIAALTEEAFPDLMSLPHDEAKGKILDWWRVRKTEYEAATGWFLRSKLAEIHDVLAAQVVGTANPRGDNTTWGDGFSYEETEAGWLKQIVSADLPLEFQGDPEARLKALRQSESWADVRFPR